MESNQSKTAIDTTTPGHLEGIRAELAGLDIDDAIKRVSDLTKAGVKSDDDARILTNAAVDLKTKSAFVENRRSEVYVPFYRRGEELREVFDTPIKAIKSALSVARDAIGELKDELEEIHQNMEEKFSETERYSKIGDAVDALESIVGNLSESVDEAQDIDFSW